MYRLNTSFIVLLLLFTQTFVWAKDAKKEAADSIKKAETAHKHFIADSLKKAAIIRRHNEADSIKAHVVQRVFSPEYADTLLIQIERLHTILNNITNETKFGFNTRKIEKQLPAEVENVKVIDQNLSRDSSVLNIKNLQMFRIMLKDMQTHLNDWRGTLFQYNRDLIKMTAEMNAFIQDSFAHKIAADTAFANLYLDEILLLKEKWRDAKKSTGDNLTRISRLQAAVSDCYFDVIELQNRVGNQLTRSGVKVFSKEFNYVWNVQSNPESDDVLSLAAESYSGQLQVLRYYLMQNGENWPWILFFMVTFFFWVLFNFRRIKMRDAGVYKADLSFLYLTPVPVMATFLFILNIAPFFDIDPPSAYVEMLQFALLIPLTIHFWRTWPRNLFMYWCIIVLLSVLASFMNAIVIPGWPLRIFLLAINGVSVFFGIRLYMQFKQPPSMPRMVKSVILLYILLNLSAAICCILGRITLAKILTTSAIMGLTQIIGLSVFIPIITEAFFLQMQASRIARGNKSAFNYEGIKNGLNKILTIISILFWLIIFTTNLDVYTALIAFLDHLLNTQRSVGSTSFTIGNLVMFLLVLYVASILQQYIGYFFGQTEDDSVSDNNRKGSGLLLLRLIIITVGFFIAIIASGLPVDKVTVVLGALSVGIGLGLQNIVFNLISGVILIFEKPMQVGDYIEVADKEGRVQDIGIRSSKLITAEGSEVIVPNGDILSSHMVNWTRSNNNRRAELVITIEPSSELPAAKEIILAELKADSFVLQERRVEILLGNYNEKSVQMTVHVWINNIYKEEEFRSEVLSKIYGRLAEKGIKII